MIYTIGVIGTQPHRVLTKLKQKRKVIEMRNELYDFANQVSNMFYRDGGYKSFPIDVVEEEGKFIVYAEIPGVKKEDITVSFEDSTLTIAAKREKGDNKKYLIHERNAMKYERSIYFNDILEDTINAKYEDGILAVTINLKKPEEKPKTKIVIE